MRTFCILLFYFGLKSSNFDGIRKTDQLLLASMKISYKENCTLLCRKAFHDVLEDTKILLGERSHTSIFQGDTCKIERDILFELMEQIRSKQNRPCVHLDF